MTDLKEYQARVSTYMIDGFILGIYDDLNVQYFHTIVDDVMPRRSGVQN